MAKAQEQELAMPLDKKYIAKREGASGRSLSYIEGHHAIREANRIFGFGGWSQNGLILNMVQEEKYTNSNNKELWRVAYTSILTVTAMDSVRQDVGYGEGSDANLGQAHESAIKEAVTDATKRCLRTFGDAFGLALYDKKQVHTTDQITKSQMDADARGYVVSLFATEEDRMQFESACEAKGFTWQGMALKCRAERIDTFAGLLNYVNLHPRKGQEQGAKLADEAKARLEAKS